MEREEVQMKGRMHEKVTTIKVHFCNNTSNKTLTVEKHSQTTV